MFLDPLSKFPGPKLAAASLWYEFYYDVIKKGRYTWQIAEMHDKYGTLNRDLLQTKSWSKSRRRLLNGSPIPVSGAATSLPSHPLYYTKPAFPLNDGQNIDLYV